jgi:hypothetical protein
MLNGNKNRFIDSIINKGTYYNFILYEPKLNAIDKEIYLTNLILKKIIQDPLFEWYSPKNIMTSTNTFGKTQYINNGEFGFEEIHVTKKNTYRMSSFCFNRIPERDNIAISNLWIVFDNPNLLKLKDFIEKIELSLSGTNCCLFHESEYIENEFSILSHLFSLDGIKYENNKIYVPIFISLNNAIFLNNIRQENRIYIGFKRHYSGMNYSVWGNICDMTKFSLSSNINIDLKSSDTNQNLYKFCSYFFRGQYTGLEKLSNLCNDFPLRFIHPTYLLYIMNVSKQNVKSMTLTLTSESTMEKNYELDDIEWFDNYAIVWFNRNFLKLEELNNSINFSHCLGRLTIYNSYLEIRDIEIRALSFESIQHKRGFTQFLFSGFQYLS